ncbi:MAG TPA: hypothetical protein VL992_14345 [Tepidisphaeraceae bacterium]|nr:hypothetical protein [Tepidisphaeraceae bacterium]
MFNSHDTLTAAAMEIRWRILSLAADFDRIERADGGAALLQSDPTIRKARQAMRIVLDGSRNRAEQIQMIFSDTTPGPR